MEMMRTAFIITCILVLFSQTSDSAFPFPDNHGPLDSQRGVPKAGSDKTSAILMLLAIPSGNDRSSSSNDVLSKLTSALQKIGGQTSTSSMSSAASTSMSSASRSESIDIQRLLDLRRKLSLLQPTSSRINDQTMPGSVGSFPPPSPPLPDPMMIAPPLRDIAILSDNLKISDSSPDFPFKTDLDIGPKIIPFPVPMRQSPAHAPVVQQPRAIMVQPPIVRPRPQATMLVQHQSDNFDNPDLKLKIKQPDSIYPPGLILRPSSDSIDQKAILVQQPSEYNSPIGHPRLAVPVDVRPKYKPPPPPLLLLQPVSSSMYVPKHPWHYEKIPSPIVHGSGFSVFHSSGGSASSGGDGGSGSGGETSSNGGD